MIAAACGGGGDGEASDGSEAQQASEEFLEEEGDLTPVPGGEVVFGVEASTTGGFCVPEAQFAVSGIQIANAIYDPLVAFNSDLEPTPFLAESIEPDAEHDQWTIRLRPGITFHNGEALDAAALKLNLDVFRGEVGDTGRVPILFRYVFRDIVAVEIVDPLTVTVSTRVPWTTFDSYWASGRFGISAPAQIRSEAAACKNTPIGTGPFKIEQPLSLAEGDDVRLVRNTTYWRPGLPYLEAITFRPQPEASRMLDGVLAADGGFDLAHFNEARARNNARDEAEAGTVAYYQEGVDYSEVSYALFNMRPDSVFADKNARLFVAHAIDRDFLNQTVNFGLNVIADGPFPPGVIGHLDDPGVPAYDPEEAQRILDEELGGQLEFTIRYLTSTYVRSVVDEIIRQLSAYPGVNVTQDDFAQSELIDVALGGNFDVLFWRNHPGYDPDGQLVWFRSDSPVNFGAIDDPELDALLDQGRSATDPAERTDIYEQVNERFASEVYNAWVWNTLWGLTTRPEVHGVLGVELPNGDQPLGIFAGWSPVTEIWVEQ